MQRTYGVMSNDVLIAMPLFLFMGYLVERAQLIDRLFRSLHLATARVPGSLAVATIVTCAIFATATGIVGAVVTLMGLLAFPAMLKAGYNIKVAAGAVTAGGCLGILIPPSVLLIVYGATAGVSVVQLYAGAFLPGFMLACLYIGYVIVLAKWKPELMPPLSESEQRVPLPAASQALAARGAQSAVRAAARARRRRPPAFAARTVFAPARRHAAAGARDRGHGLQHAYRVTTAPVVEASAAGLIEAGGDDRGRRLAGRVGRADRRARRPRSRRRSSATPQRHGARAEARGQLPRPRRQAARGRCAERVPPSTWFYVVARASASARSCSSTGCGTGSGSRCSRCC